MEINCTVTVVTSLPESVVSCNTTAGSKIGLASDTDSSTELDEKGHLSTLVRPH